MTAGALVPCPGCGCRLPAEDGPTHPYMLSTPGCWRAYGEVLAREYSDPARAGLHRLAVDAYAVQHPGGGDRRARQSVAIHLMSLCLMLERGGSDEQARRLLSQAAAERAAWPRLSAPRFRGDPCVLDVLASSSAEGHLDAVRRWAAGSWGAWAAEHERVREWLDVRLG